MATTNVDLSAAQLAPRSKEGMECPPHILLWWQVIWGSAVALAVVIAVVYAVRSHAPWMIFFQDDFYYYLKVANNLAHGHGSTFNGIVTTNGYHPLWLMLLTAICRVVPQGPQIFLSVAVVIAISTGVTYVCAYRLLKRVGIGHRMSGILGVYIAIFALHLFYSGMEVILAVPLIFLLLVLLEWRGTNSKGTGYGFIVGLVAAAAILSRLDVGILVAMLIVSFLSQATLRSTLRRDEMLGFCVGLLPLALYLYVNHHFFGLWLPVSGMAKELRTSHVPSIRPWKSVYQANAFNLLNLLPIHIAIIALPWAWKRLTPAQRVICPAALLFPFVYYGVLSIVSDWQLWLWYMYPTRAALCAGIIVLAALPRAQTLMRNRWLEAILVLVIAKEVISARWWTIVQPPIYAAAVELNTFSQTHPGVYAMGDRAGMAGYLMQAPLVQTEGLMMDRTFLDRIRAQENLIEALAAYHVRYYVATETAPHQGCFHAIEPIQAGKSSAHMEATICAPPVALWEHEQYRTMVFDLQPGKTTR